MGHEFVFCGPAGEVELNHLQGANGWLTTHPETDEKTGDDSQVDLDLDAVGAVSLGCALQKKVTRFSPVPAR